MIFLGVRPSISHVIGISGLAKAAFQSEIDHFLNEKHEEDFLVVSKNVWNQIEYGDEIKEDYKNVSTFDVVSSFESSSIDVFGMFPVFHLNESHLYNHSLLWCMLEAGVLKDETKTVKLPYQDVSEFVRKDHSILRQNFRDRNLARELEFYDGKWARKYPNESLSFYDEDLDFALKFFHEIGVMVKPDDLDRYFIFEWA